MSKIALLLAGGGSRGLLQAGFLLAFKDLNLSYDTLYGSSAGTLNGLLVHQDDYDKLYHLWMTIRTRDIYKKNDLFIPYFIKFKNCLYDSSPLYKLISNNLNYEKLLENPKSFYINATDYTNKGAYRQEVKNLSKEEVITLAKASANPPIYFELVKFRNLLLADAGVNNNYSITQAIQDGHDTLILMTPTKVKKKDIRNILDILNLTLEISMTTYFLREKECTESINEIIDEINISLEPDYKKIRIILIAPDKEFDLELLDFEYKNYDRKELIMYGYNIARSILEKEFCS